MTSSPNELTERLHRRANFYVDAAQRFYSENGLYPKSEVLIGYATLLAVIDMKYWLEETAARRT